MSFNRKLSLRITEASADLVFEARTLGLMFLELIKKLQAG